MKIEMAYNPVEPQTHFAVNGIRVKADDIYGFCYPVRRKMLQTWLNPSGSWQGLLEQIRGIARGEGVGLIFYGREADFEDVSAALKNAAEIKSLALVAYDPLPDYQKKFRGDLSAYSHLNENPVDNLFGGVTYAMEQIKNFFPREGAIFSEIGNFAIKKFASFQEGQRWKIEIDSDEAWEEADEEGRLCCFVADGYLDSFEKLEKLHRMTRSLRRGADMICCCVDDEAKKEEYSNYAAQNGFGGIRFCLGADRVSAEALLQAKYGEPYLMAKAKRDWSDWCETARRDINDRLRKCISKIRNTTDSALRGNIEDLEKELDNMNRNAEEFMQYTGGDPFAGRKDGQKKLAQPKPKMISEKGEKRHGRQ